MQERFKYRSVNDLARRIALDLWRVPETVDVIVALPHTGALAACFLGLQICRPVVDLDRFLDIDGPGYGHALIVDDTCRTGATISAAREKIADRFPKLRLTTLAVYCQQQAENHVDMPLETTEGELLLEWSLFQSPIMAKACLDMDGILCGDATTEQDDDGANYLDFLSNTSRHAVPLGYVHRIVTSRLEKYRAETEAWLSRHRIAYGTLTMLNLPSEAERRRLRPQGRFKAEVYQSDPDAILFVESETWQAKEIARAAPGKAVFDYKTRTLFDSDTLKEASLKEQVKNRLLAKARRMLRPLRLDRLHAVARRAG